MAYQDFAEFYSWYLEKIKEQVPDYAELPPEFVHAKLKNLTMGQIEETTKFITNLIKLPKDIRLLYFPYDPANRLYTFASNFNPYERVFHIYYPTVTYWMKEFPKALKEVIKHEIGHIMNKDVFVESEDIHKGCINRSMDARINIHLDEKLLEYASLCLFFHKEFVNPKTYYPDIGLEFVEGGYTWDFAHDQYHRFNKPEIEEPKIPNLGPFRPSGISPPIPKIETPEDDQRSLLKLGREVKDAINTLQTIVQDLVMSPEQKKIVDSAMEEDYNSILNQINTGVGNATELYEKFYKINESVNKGLHPILKKSEEASNTYYEKRNTVNVTGQTPCGILNRQPKYHAGDIVLGNSIAENIKDEVKANPIDYSELQELTEQPPFSLGAAGAKLLKIKLPEIGVPNWIAELESELVLFKRRRRTKVFYDPEALARGIPAKERAKKILRERTAWILLDVSGSMFGLSYKGTSILELCAAHIPPIARGFEGELWEVDEGAPTKIIPLKELKSDDISEMEIRGGEGTNFDYVLSMLRDIREKIRKENPTADFLTILFTDAGVSWNLSLLPDNFIIVTIKGMEMFLPELEPERNQRFIVIDVEK